jgi:hypothetical protein
METLTKWRCIFHNGLVTNSSFQSNPLKQNSGPRSASAQTTIPAGLPTILGCDEFVIAILDEQPHNTLPTRDTLRWSDTASLATPIVAEQLEAVNPSRRIFSEMGIQIPDIEN